MPGLEITDCRVRPCAPGQGDEKLCAFATITFNHAFVVCDLKVINGNEGVFVAMPSRRRKDGSFRDIAHPLNAETRLQIERAVLREYLRELDRAGEALPSLPAHLSIEELRAEAAAADLYRPAALAVMADRAGAAGARPETPDPSCGGVEPDLQVPRTLTPHPQPAVMHTDRLDTDLLD